MQIAIYADFVCPWCFIGKRRLEHAAAMWRDKALDTDDGQLKRHWRPFQLNPTMPPEGMERDAYLNWKLGGADRVAFIHDRLAKDAGELADIAAAQGLPRAEAEAYLRGDGGLEAMREADVQARARGVNAVPCYVMRDSYALSGAQPPEVFLRMFEFARGAQA